MIEAAGVIGDSGCGGVENDELVHVFDGGGVDCSGLYVGNVGCGVIGNDPEVFRQQA